jgi:hypothetical protein
LIAGHDQTTLGRCSCLHPYSLRTSKLVPEGRETRVKTRTLLQAALTEIGCRNKLDVLGQIPLGEPAGFAVARPLAFPRGYRRLGRTLVCSLKQPTI